MYMKYLVNSIFSHLCFLREIIDAPAEVDIQGSDEQLPQMGKRSLSCSSEVLPSKIRYHHGLVKTCKKALKPFRNQLASTIKQLQGVSVALATGESGIQ